MRYLKRLLTSIYIFLGAFTIACFIAWLIIRDEPTALIAGVFAGVGIESIVAGIIKIREIKAEKELREKEISRFKNMRGE